MIPRYGAGRNVMATVVMHAVVSVDGFIADERVGVRSAPYVRDLWSSIGATIQGRHLFDLTNGWDARPPAGDHLLVVSHRPRPDGWHPEADVPFHTDVAEAVADARGRAGDRVVAICAGEMGGQALALGLVDEVAMDVVPVVFGRGKRYFGSTDEQHLLGNPTTVIQGDRVLHLRYPVAR